MLFLDNEPLTEGLSPINTTINNRISYTYQELVNHRFTWKDNGKKLRCVLQHDALGSNDQKEATIDLDISCEYNFPYMFLLNLKKRERTHKSASCTFSASPIIKLPPLTKSSMNPYSVFFLEAREVKVIKSQVYFLPSEFFYDAGVVVVVIVVMMVKVDYIVLES